MRMQMERAFTIVQSCMRACVLYARGRAWRRIADVSGAAAGMQIMRRIYMRLRLVSSRMSLLWRAIQVDLIARRKGVCAYAWVRCRYEV